MPDRSPRLLSVAPFWAALLIAMHVSQAALAQQPAVALGAAPATLVVPLRVPLVVDGRQRAEVDVLLEPGTGRVRAAADALMRELAALLAEGPEQDLSRNADAAGMVSLEDLRLLGLRASFDEEALKLHVDVPAALRAVVDLPMRAFLPAGTTGEPVAPARTSAFLNLRGGLTSVAGAQNATSGAVAADGAFNFEGWAVEARGAWLQGNSPPFVRTATRLVRDVPEKPLRLTAGDLAYPVRGFQSFLPLGGIAAAKDFSLQPYRQVRAAGATTFFLDTPATVEFFVNDRLVRSARLPAGPYAAHSFPFLAGVNDVRISIVDAFGARRVMDFSVGFDATLLKAGETEWSYAAGFPASPRAGDIEYDVRSPAASVFHRWGLTDALTIEANAQADRWVETAGGAAVAAHRLGVARVDFAVSHSDQSAGYAGRLQYEYRDSRPSNVAGRTVGLSLRHVSSEFLPLGTLEPFNPVAWDAAARYGQRIGLHLRLGVGVDYQFGREERRDTAGGSLSLQRSLFRGADAGIRLRDEIDDEGTRSQSVFVTFSVRPGPGQEVSVYRDTGTGSTRSDWRYVPDQVLGRIAARVEAEREPAAQRVNGEVEYVGWRGTAAIAAGSAEGRGDGGAADTRTLTMRGTTALVYADGAVAIGRPVTQAFAVFVPHPSLAGYPIGVNPAGEGEYQARIDGLGPAVLPEVTPYWHTAARLDTRGLPIGLASGPSVFDIVAGYDRGTKVVVGTGATVFLLATIERVDGSPVGLQAARVVAEDDPAFVPILTFTNRVGRMAVEGLRPGRYRIELLSAPQAPLQFTVPASAEGQIDIGPLVLAAEGER